MRTIPLTRGHVALVDDEDFEALSQFKWGARRKDHLVYAVRKVRAGPYRQRDVLMHREILAAPRGTDVDHINGNGCDNRRANLRAATREQNARNSRARTDGTSRFRGVSWYRPLERWRAALRGGGKTIHVGYFHNEEEAARAYDDAARQHHGAFASLNFPREGERSAHRSAG